MDFGELSIRVSAAAAVIAFVAAVRWAGGRKDSERTFRWAYHAMTATLVGGTVGNLVGFFLVVVSFWMKARMEERLLLVEFGDEYAAYRRNVKFMIPFVL